MRKKRGGLVRLGQAVTIGAPLFGSAHLRGELVLANVTPVDGATGMGPVWVQIARTGKWMGHPAHPEGVEFTRHTFDQVLANLHANPAFTPGANGVGTAPVVPFDYEHASEMDPTSGSIPQDGAPAPAWVLDVQIRASTDGTTDELWALTDLGPKAREQVANKEYRWTSVSIWPSARDSTTNKPIGALLTSVALTNHPFIQGMNPLAIAARARGVRASVSVYGTAESPEQAIVGMRDIFGLPPDATVDQIAAQFKRLGEILATPQTDGEEDELYDRAEEIACRLRDLLGVPTLSSLDEIVAAGGQILSAMSLTQPSASAATGASPMNPPSQFTTRLCAIFRLRDGVTDEKILLAAEEVAKSQDALDKLIALFGSSDTQSLLSDAAGLVEKAKKAETYLTALNAANEQLGAHDKKAAEGEVEQIAASMHLGEEAAARLKPLLLKERLACTGDQVKLAAFRSQYPLPTQQQQLLTQPLVAGPNGTQLGSSLTAYAPISLTAGGSGQQQQAQQHPLMTYGGRNTTEQAMAYLSDKRPGFKTKPRIDQVHEAGLYLREGAPVL